MAESKFYHFSRKVKFTSVATVDEALAEAKNGGFMWLDYCQPTKEELSKLIDPLGFHPLSIEDCLDENQIPKRLAPYLFVSGQESSIYRIKARCTPPVSGDFQLPPRLQLTPT
jgi:hypothetical protein